MNDRVNGVDPMTYANRLNLSTVGGLMALSDTVAIVNEAEKADVREAVNNSNLNMTEALMAWLIGVYNYGLVDIQQVNNGMQSLVTMHEAVLATLYEYVFGAVPTGSVEEVMS